MLPENESSLAFIKTLPMAVILNIVESSISVDGKYLNLTDATGLYNVSDNPGGYGTPNPNKNQVATILLANNKRQDEGDVLLTVQPYNPIVDYNYIVNIYKDGWYQIKSFGLRLYSTNTSFSITEAAYDSASGEIRKILTKSGTGPYVYTYQVLAPSDLDSDTVITYTESILNVLVLVNLLKCYTNAIKVFFNNASPVTNITVLTDDANFNTKEKIQAYLEAIQADFGFTYYTQAQLMVEQTENICSCIKDCNCG